MPSLSAWRARSAESCSITSSSSARNSFGSSPSTCVICSQHGRPDRRACVADNEDAVHAGRSERQAEPRREPPAQIALERVRPSADAQLHDLRKWDEEGGLEAGFHAGAQQQHRPHLERHRPQLVAPQRVAVRKPDLKALLDAVVEDGPPVSDRQPTLDVLARGGPYQQVRRKRRDGPRPALVLELGCDMADAEAEAGADEPSRAVAYGSAAVVDAAEKIEREGGAAESLQHDARRRIVGGVD